MAVGDITRGTTSPNRLRRMDRWILHAACGTIRAATDPVVVDLGYGTTPITTVELRKRLQVHVRDDIEVIGVEIDPERVAGAQPLADASLSFRFGGFEVPLEGGRSPILIRAANVLRQYDQDQVRDAWSLMTGRLAPEGFLVEGTCDEIGRRSCWVTLRAGSSVPESFSMAAHVGSLERPSDLAPRLPKALIHGNVPGQPIHDFLRQFDDAWQRCAGLIPYGARQRWIAAVEMLADSGVPVSGGKARWRLGEVTVPWAVVSPASFLD